MASLSKSRSVWFTTLLIVLFFWNIFHNSDTLAPPPIEVVEEVSQDATEEIEDYSSIFPEPPQPEIYEPELPVNTEEDDYLLVTKPPATFGWKSSQPIVPPAVIDVQPAIVAPKLTGADNTIPPTANYLDIPLPNPEVDPTVPVDPLAPLEEGVQMATADTIPTKLNPPTGSKEFNALGTEENTASKATDLEIGGSLPSEDPFGFTKQVKSTAKGKDDNDVHTEAVPEAVPLNPMLGGDDFENFVEASADKSAPEGLELAKGQLGQNDKTTVQLDGPLD